MSGGIFLNIERIVLDGFDHVDRRALAAALRQALVEQLAFTGIGQSSATPLARTHITLQESFSATQLGQSLARDLCSVIRDSGAVGTTGRGGAQGAEADA